MTRSAGCVAALVAVLMVAGWAARLPAQQPASLQTELLAEVRLLRQSIEALAGTNARVQIVFGRLQLQEQRTATAARRLDALRSALADISTRAAEMADSEKELDAFAADTLRRPEEAENAREQLRAVRRELGRIEAERTRLMGEEAEAAGALNLEQGRWSDLNRQLEELERQLAPKQ
jgi:chromosome segregation ATPase